MQGNARGMQGNAKTRLIFAEDILLKDLRSGNVLFKDIKISLGLLITARKQHAEYRGNRNFNLSTTPTNRIMIFVIEAKIPNKTQPLAP